jgi:hypothetical protein
MTRFVPADLSELRDAIAEALSAGEPLELVAGGTKRGLGRPLQLPHSLDLSRLSGIRDYQPSELVLTAAAATPLAEIEAALGEAHQMLAFEPPRGARSAASSPATCRDRAASGRGRRATIFSASARSAAAARRSRRAARWSRMSPATICRNCWRGRSARWRPWRR